MVSFLLKAEELPDEGFFVLEELLDDETEGITVAFFTAEVI